MGGSHSCLRLGMFQRSRSSYVLITAIVCLAASALHAQSAGRGEPPYVPEPADASVSRPLVNLPYVLNASPYSSCEGGVCRSEYRDVRTNRSPAKVQAALDAQDPANLPIEMRNGGLQEIGDATSRALGEADRLVAGGHGDQLLQVIIYLDELPFDLAQARHLRGAADRQSYENLLRQRARQLEPSRAAVEGLVRELGGHFAGGLRLSNTTFALVPAAGVETLIGTYPVVGVELDDRDRNGSDGKQRRLALGLPAGGLNGINGEEGGLWSAYSQVLFGVIEADSKLNTGHVGFLDWAGGASNIVDTDRCTWWAFQGTACINSATTSNSSHGTTVTGVLMASVQQGQDPNVTTTDERRKRSGIAVEGKVHFYSYDYGSALSVAIDEAIWDGADVINLSTYPEGEYCDNGSHYGVRSSVQLATALGTLFVTIAGNDADAVPFGTCSVNAYGSFPDSLTVGATEHVADLAGLDTVDIADYSGRGDTDITLAGGRVVPSRMVDLLATGYVDLVPGAGADGYLSGQQGTSFAAPQVAGAAGLLLDWVEGRGGLFDIYGNGNMERDPYALRVLLSVMGDGVSSTSGWYSDVYSMRSYSGFGHLRFVDLDSEIGGGGAWGLHRYWMSQGQVIEWSVGNSGPESASVNGWKMAALWDIDYYNDSPDIKFELVDKCPAGGGEQVIRTASRYPAKARMRMHASELSSKFHGKCLYVRATAEHVNGSTRVYAADYFYTNARDQHDMP